MSTKRNVKKNDKDRRNRRETEHFLPDESLRSYERINDRIYSRLIRTEQNREALERIPFEPWMDLAVTCYVQMEKDGSADGIQVTSDLLELWGVSKEEVLHKAWKNTIDRKDPVFRNLRDVILEMSYAAGFGDIPGYESSSLFLLSNKERWYGAVCIAYPLIPFFIEKTLQISSYYVLPSSVHECLILPDEGMYEKEELDALVRRVNRMELEPADILCSHVYYYTDGHLQPV